MVLLQLGGQISGVKAVFVYCWWEKQKSAVSDGSSLPGRTVQLQQCKRMNRRSSRGLWHTHHFHRALTHVYISRDRLRQTFLHMNTRLNRAGEQNEVSSSPHWALWWGNFVISFHRKSLLAWRCTGTVRGKHRSEALYKVRFYPTFVVLLRLFV